MATSNGAVDNITANVLRNLRDQHDWTSLQVHTDLGRRPVIRGLPPKRLYVSPDDQIAALSGDDAAGLDLIQTPEEEWVLAVHVEEKWSISAFASVFDAIRAPGPRGKRLLLATIHNDSTVVYYFMHEGMVKPRQN